MTWLRQQNWQKGKSKIHSVWGQGLYPTGHKHGHDRVRALSTADGGEGETAQIRRGSLEVGRLEIQIIGEI